MKGKTVDGRIPYGAAALCATLVAPLAALAQNGTENYFFPPKIATFGKTTVPANGAGKVVVKVFVKADGSFTVSGVLRTSNAGDNAAALDIAKHSTYHPAGRGVKKTPVAAYYDFTVKFTGTGATSDDDESAGGSSGLGAYESQIRAGKYADAQTGLNAYLQAHPNDQKATVDLALAQSFLGDYTSAAASFDKVTTIPDDQKQTAARAYSEASRTALKAKSYDAAVAYAKKAVALSPGAYTHNDLGMAEDGAGDHDAAVADLEKARDESKTFKTSDRVAIDLNLVALLYSAGKDDQTKPVLAEITSLDPTNVGAQNVGANHYIRLATAADAANKPDDAENYWSQAATAVPHQAADFYGHAALDEVGKKSGSQLDKANSYAKMGLAADPNNAICNYVAGFVLAKQGKKSDALTYLNKVDASAKAGNDTAFTTAVEALIKQVNGS